MDLPGLRTLRTLGELWRRLRFLLLRDRLTAEIEEEIRLHEALRAAQYQGSGITRDEAARMARRKLGRATRHVEASRDVWMARTLDAITMDVRYAVRGLRTRWGLTLAVVTTLALGIGANAAMFGIVDRLFFRPPEHLMSPARVYRVYFERRNTTGVVDLKNTQYDRYEDLVRAASSVELAAVASPPDDWSGVIVGKGEAAQQVDVAAVSATLWQLFDARPVLGRFFGPAEDRSPFGSKVVVLSFAYWQSRFGGSSDVLGRRLAIGPSVYSIIGVAPPGFSALSLQPPMAFVPVTAFGADKYYGPEFRYTSGYDITWLEMYVRLEDRVSASAASADLTTAWLRSLRAELGERRYQDYVATRQPRVILGPPQLQRGPNRSLEGRVVTWLLGVASIVLLIACANVANLLLARVLRRRREVAVRLALGVSRARLAGQLLIESLLLGALGGAAGLVVAQWGGRALAATLFPRGWGGRQPGIALLDGRVLAVTGAITCVVGLLTGIAPMLQATRSDVIKSLKSGAREGGTGPGGGKVRIALLFAQTALSVVLLVSAGLFVRSLRRAESVHLGFDATRVLQLQVSLRGTVLDSAGKAQLTDRLLERARELPEVVNATRGLTVPFDAEASLGLFVPGIDSVEKRGYFVLQTTSPSYFATLGTRLLRGRGFTAFDDAHAARVMVVSAAMARALWPNESAIGRCVRIGSDTAPCSEVVGIAEDVKHGTLTADPAAPMLYYVPAAQLDPGLGVIFVRTRGPAAADAQVVRAALQRLLPGLAYLWATPMERYVAPALKPWEMGATMFTLFGVLALALAAVGLYGVVSYDVSQRWHEIGVRVALGARPGVVVRLIVLQTCRIVVAALIVGGGVALGAGRWLASLLFQVSPYDPVVFAGVAGTLLTTALFAGWLPARRAASVDPVSALRME